MNGKGRRNLDKNGLWTNKTWVKADDLLTKEFTSSI
jgi:hypothetical protein